MSEKSGLKTGSVKVKFNDGSERVLPIHGLNAFDFMNVLDQLEIKSFEELQFKPASLAAIRAIEKCVALGLSFPNGEQWSVEKIRSNFSGLEQVAEIFTQVVAISNLPQPPASAKPDQKTRRTYG